MYKLNNIDDVLLWWMEELPLDEISSDRAAEIIESFRNGHLTLADLGAQAALHRLFHHLLDGVLGIVGVDERGAADGGQAEQASEQIAHGFKLPGYPPITPTGQW